MHAEIDWDQSNVTNVMLKKKKTSSHFFLQTFSYFGGIYISYLKTFNGITDPFNRL